MILLINSENISYIHRPIYNGLKSMSEKLKISSVVVFFALIILAPAIQELLNEEISKYVDDSESAHDGLPTKWENKQVICIFFPTESPHAEFSQGVTMIDSNGNEIGKNLNLNRTGACLGGFEGYSDGLSLMMDSTRLVGGSLSVGYVIGQWGPYVHTIGGLNADTMSGEFNGAYWNLDHNGATSAVGIGDLVMSEGDVVEWTIATW